MEKQTGSFIALLPILLFLGIFIGSGVYYHQQAVDFAFYQIKAPVAILPAIILAFILAKGKTNSKIETFVKGVGDQNIILMCLVFLLAGAFASVTKSIGGVDATVNIGLSVIPASLLLPGIFIISAFIATAMGTSMGTIAAVAPLALQVAVTAGLPEAVCIGAVIGGAMFGDNLSVISDTTIAATRTQGCDLKDKFRENIKIAAPAAVLTIILLFVMGEPGQAIEAKPVNGWLALPYLIVLALAVMGLNVLTVLMIGIAVSGVMGMLVTPDYGLETLSKNIYAGYEGMLEIMVLSMLIGGLAMIMKQQGGMQWVIDKITRLGKNTANKSQKAGEASVGLLAAISGIFTANNTIAIIIAGGVAKDVSQHYGISSKRSASLLDIFACVVQGLLPYGAQILLAGSIAGLSPLALIGNVYYCWVLGGVAILVIGLGLFSSKTAVTQSEALKEQSVSS
ncbi:Na+/H+ antiporter NhaC family protein [Spartinivicinus poritis]|uniref:Na+/H+ antiporter NhaC family protein n=1 Tax=Spartinivicinus poritis TaxID=2994640 RepID=A0ABT5U6K4_9GAMM|nr:Na+/H+ antiporter NhaC family protein [Spartinivicinus sp. A2-2]MDE1461995.1 Na+/H+ antiporter NhaC family protein [Spartinivicinus sp. A2-2]